MHFKGIFWSFVPEHPGMPSMVVMEDKHPSVVHTDLELSDISSDDFDADDDDESSENDDEKGLVLFYEVLMY